ncbi:MAG: PASTA domain-containing protein, partial [Fusicatenibacter saccharivorans]|nr:PASTA domain-containing protein [Fusicatenibacter saccharivorans]
IVKTGTSSKVAEGEVMEVDPAVGTKVKKGSDVTIYVNSPSAQPTTPDENTPTPTPAEPGANTATDVTWSCSQTLSAPDQYQGGIAKIELIQDDGNGNETSITVMDGQAITSWPYSVNTNWSASSSASSTGRIVFYEMDSSGSYQAIAQYPSVPLSEG